MVFQYSNPSNIMSVPADRVIPRAGFLVVRNANKQITTEVVVAMCKIGNSSKDSNPSDSTSVGLVILTDSSLFL